MSVIIYITSVNQHVHTVSGDIGKYDLPSTPPTTSSSGTGSTMQNSQPQQQQTNWESRIRKRGTGVSPIVPIIILIVIIAAAAGGYFYFGKSLGNILPSSTLSTIGATTFNKRLFKCKCNKWLCEYYSPSSTLCHLLRPLRQLAHA